MIDYYKEEGKIIFSRSKFKPDKIPAWKQGREHEILPLAEDLLVFSSFWKSGSQF